MAEMLIGAEQTAAAQSIYLADMTGDG